MELEVECIVGENFSYQKYFCLGVSLAQTRSSRIRASFIMQNWLNVTEVENCVLKPC